MVLWCASRKAENRAGNRGREDIRVGSSSSEQNEMQKSYMMQAAANAIPAAALQEESTIFSNISLAGKRWKLRSFSSLHSSSLQHHSAAAASLGASCKSRMV